MAFFLTRYHDEIIVVNHMRTIIIERLEGLSNLKMVCVEHFHNLVYYILPSIKITYILT